MLNVSAFRSTDGGKTLTNVGGGTHGDHHDLWIDPDDPKHLVIGNDGGGAVSTQRRPRHAGWTRAGHPDARSTTTSSRRSTCPFHVCGAQQDGSTVCVPSNTNLGGGGRRRRWRRRRAAAARAPELYSPGGAEPGYIAPDPLNVDIFYAGGNNGSFLTRLDRRTGKQREVNPYPRMFSGEPASALVERWQWTYPIIFSPADPTRALHLVAARVADDERRRQLGQDQPRPHAARSEDDGTVGRADHARHEQPRGLRDGLRARARARRTSTSSGPDRTTASCT